MRLTPGLAGAQLCCARTWRLAPLDDGCVVAGVVDGLFGRLGEGVKAARGAALHISRGRVESAFSDWVLEHALFVANWVIHRRVRNRQGGGTRGRGISV